MTKIISVKTIIVLSTLFLFCFCVKAQEKLLTFGFSYELKSITNPYIIILEVVPGGAAEKAKIKSGDTLTAINNESVAIKSDAEITDLIILAKQKERIELIIKGKPKNIVLKPIVMNRYNFVKQPNANNKVVILNNFTLWSYDGEFKDGFFNGKGTYTFLGKYKHYPLSSIVKQVGNFEKNSFVDGITYFKNGDSFEGIIKYGKQNGQGTYTINNGVKYIGNFNDYGLFDGIFKVIDSKGIIREEVYKNGVFVSKKN